MTQELFFLFSAIGILLTFLASITAVVVSLVSMKSSKQTTKQTNYQNIISTARAKWQSDLRESASKYFAQIALLCEGRGDLSEALCEFTRYHFAVSLLFFKQDDRRPLHNEMSAIKKKTSKMVDLLCVIMDEYREERQSPDKRIAKIESMDSIISARKEIDELRSSILNDHQHNVFDEIQKFVEIEWRKQQYEATDMWKNKH